MLRTLYTISAVLICAMTMSAQSGDLLSYEQYIRQVLMHHPVAIQYQMLDRQSELYKLKARGEFDPKLAAYYDEKEFKAENYYETFDAQLSVPTATGIDFKLGYEMTDGAFLDPNQSLPANGLINIGAELPLLQGLMFDERRQVLRQAELLIEGNEVKQREGLAKIQWEASKAYLDWQVAQQSVLINLTAEELAEIRLENVIVSFRTGEGRGIDTVEAKANLLNRQQLVQESQLILAQARRQVELYLWANGLQPLVLDPQAKAQALQAESAEALLVEIRANKDSLLRRVPAIQSIDIERRSLEIDERLAKQYMLPDLRVKWNTLVTPGSEKSVLSSVNDYKVGVSLSYPLLNRKARGELALNRLDQEMLANESVFVQQSTEILLDQLMLEISSLAEQVRILQVSVAEMQKLLEAEQIKFEIGESSIFLVNSRELKLLETQIKLLKLQKDYSLATFDIRGLLALDWI